MDDKCTLRVRKVILSIVTLLNLIKCVFVTLTIRLHNLISDTYRYLPGLTRKRGSITQTFARALQVVSRPKPFSASDKSLYIVTLGDAMASFLQNGDNETQTCGLASSKDFERGRLSHILGSRFALIC